MKRINQLILLAFLMVCQIGFSNVYTVTNGNNSGLGSLRNAIQQANINSGADEIAFTTTATINLTSDIIISDDLLISNNGTQVVITGNSGVVCFMLSNGLRNSTFKDLKLIGFQQAFKGSELLNISFENIETENSDVVDFQIDDSETIMYTQIKCTNSGSGFASISGMNLKDVVVNDVQTDITGINFQSGEDIIVSNCEIGDPNIDDEPVIGINFLNTDDLVIENNTIFKSDVAAVLVSGGNNILFRNNVTYETRVDVNRFENCTNINIINNQALDESETEGGIRVRDVVGGTIKGNTVKGRMQIESSSQLTIGGPNEEDGNFITKAMRFSSLTITSGGITLINSDDNLIQNNRIEEFSRVGISLRNCSNNRLISNVIQSNEGPGVFIDKFSLATSVNNVFSRNSISNNDRRVGSIPFLKSGINYFGLFSHPAPVITTATGTNQGVVITGTAQANDVIEVFYDTIVDNIEATENARLFAGSTTANGAGTWSLTVPFTTLQNLSVDFIATATSAVNGTSEFSNASRFGIEGRAVLCNLSPITYSVPEIPGAVYNWWVGSGDKGGYVNFVNNNRSTAEVRMKFVRTYPTLVIETFTLNVQVITPTSNYIVRRKVISFPCLNNVITVGPTEVCRGEPNTYAVLGREGDTYNWWVDGEANFDTRASNEVEITFGQSFTSGTVTAQVQNQLCGTVNNYTFDVTASTCTAKIGEFLSEVNSCSPNPFSQTTILSLDEGIERVEVYNSAGILIDEFKLDSGSKSLELGQSYPSGIYLVYFIKGLVVSQLKVVKG